MLLIVVVPTIQKIVLDTQNKSTVAVPFSDADESALEEETEECDNLEIHFDQQFYRYFTTQLSSPFQASCLLFKLPDNIILPPPKI